MNNISNFISEQLSQWPLASANFRALDGVETKGMTVGGLQIKAQFNPARIASASAKTDNVSVAKRPCFLCPENRYAEQFSLPFIGCGGMEYDILVNPFPIFPDHIVIAAKEHVVQSIWNRFLDLLALARAHHDFIFLYNGPKCGASAPDHHHFQGTGRGKLPLENNIDSLLDAISINAADSENAISMNAPDGSENTANENANVGSENTANENANVGSGNTANENANVGSGNASTENSLEYLTSCGDAELFHYKKFTNGIFVLRGRTAENTAALFHRLLDCAPLEEGDSEPRFNMFAYYKGGEYRCFVIFRTQHRSHHFFSTGDDHLTMSPGAVDMAGLFIVPVKEDYEKITADMLSDMLSEISLTAKTDEIMCWRLSRTQRTLSVGIMSAKEIVFEFLGSDGAGKREQTERGKEMVRGEDGKTEMIARKNIKEEWTGETENGEEIRLENKKWGKVGIEKNVGKGNEGIENNEEKTGNEGERVKCHRERKAVYKDGKIEYEGALYDELYFEPKPLSSMFAEPAFILHGVTIGKGFHWQRVESQRFAGALKIIVEDGMLTAVNVVGVEDYLLSVISSEMNAAASLELLKAHAVISRSWVMARLVENEKSGREEDNLHIKEEFHREIEERDGETSIICWYGSSQHRNYDVCADDHCQRYQGLTRAVGENVRTAIDATWGEVLEYGGEICDARFSKCCGGKSELFSTCWDDQDCPYLKALPDTSEHKPLIYADNQSFAFPQEHKPIPITEGHPNMADNMERKIDEGDGHIGGSENAGEADIHPFCDTDDREILSQVLNDYDLETRDFYRWSAVYDRDEISALISRKTGTDIGTLLSLEPLQRGPSGRIRELRIKGEKATLTVGKELEIRKILSDTHLKSSAFEPIYLDAQGNAVEHNANWTSLILRGKGWGHGVGLCQIGAAVMASRGYGYRQILEHYYPGSTLANPALVPTCPIPVPNPFNSIYAL